MGMNDAVQNLQVLVVDDSPVSRKLLEHALTAEPYALLFAKNGEEALRLFSENNPALVITDWMLPDLSVDALRAIDDGAARPYIDRSRARPNKSGNIQSVMTRAGLFSLKVSALLRHFSQTRGHKVRR